MNASLDAEPTETVMVLLVAGVKDPSVAVMVYPAPILSIEQPVKVNTPNVSLSPQPERLAPLVPVPAVMARLTVEESAVAALPKTSSAVTTG